MDFFPEDISIPSLMRAQEMVRARTVFRDDYSGPWHVGGVDQSFRDDCIISGIVVVDYTSMEVVERVYYIGRIEFPYIPTYLSFREGPAIISAFRKLAHRPDVLMVDGCGINHPRGAGLATHIGVALDVPTIGITKHKLCGEGMEPTEEGEVNPLTYNGEQVGWLIKSCRRCRPIIAAPGHRVSMEGALRITKDMLKGHKLPEPCLLAHQYVNRLKKQ